MEPIERDLTFLDHPDMLRLIFYPRKHQGTVRETKDTYSLSFPVDKDIDIYDPLSVEWAMATRFQGDVRMVIKDKEPGSSLDPSAEPGTKMTTKIGFDLTKPLIAKAKSFNRADFPKVDINKYF